MAKEKKDNKNALSIVIPVLMALWVILIIADIINNLMMEKEVAQVVPREEVSAPGKPEGEYFESGLPAEAEWGNEQIRENE